MTDYRVESKTYYKYDYPDESMAGSSGLSTFSNNASYLFEVWFNAENQIHRDYFPAVIVRDIRSGEIVGEEWFRNGLRHRGDGYPSLSITGDGPPIYEWRENGLLHRENGPALLRRSSDEPHGIILNEQWYKEGKHHRIGGPAIISQSFSGVITAEDWFVNGLPHKHDGPAMVSRDSDTAIVTHEIWYFHGARHRVGGPAYIERDGRTGEVIDEEHNRCDTPGPSPSPAP